MRIGWIITGFSKDEKDFGGAAAIHNLARELSLRNEIELVIFSFYYPVNQPEYNFYNAKVYSFADIKNVSKFEKIRLWKRCRKKFEEEHNRKPFDVIHSIWSGESGYIASRLSKELKLPFIANVCGGELAELPEIHYGSRTKFWQKLFVDTALERADKIVAGSNYIIDKIRAYYDDSISNKVVKIPLGVDENLFYPNKTKSDSPSLVTIGSAVPVKAYNVMLKAMKITVQKNSSIKLTICGNYDKNILPKLIQELKLENNVVITGFIDYENIPSVLNDVVIFTLSSLYESQNMSILEAAFCGLPVVSTNVGIASEITENLVEPGNAEKLAEKIIYVIENYKAESERALSKITGLKEKFSLINCVSNLIELYKSIGDKRILK
jgi:glycosyltransferase involved in cell wall biosynthesis